MTNLKAAASALTGPLREHFDRKEAQLQAVLDRIAQTELSVLVLGPGKQPKAASAAKQALYRKRCEIRDRLNALPGISAFFPEDPGVSEYFRTRAGLSDSVLPNELVQMHFADVIIALEPAPGAEQEVAIIAANPSLGPKTLNLLPLEYLGTPTSFPALIRQGRILRRYYTPDELDACTIASQVCPEHVRTEQTLRLVTHSAAP
ncbi:MAG: hypothetical protein R2909_06895 [Gemmatimonadales bacterium]